MSALKVKDYSVTLRDSSGKKFDVSIAGDSILEEMRCGNSLERASYDVEQNAFANAIYNGNIGSDCEVESYNK